MRYDEAFEISKGCEHALGVVLKPTSDRRPPPDIESQVVCKLKAQRGEGNISCDDSCPIGRPILVSVGIATVLIVIGMPILRLIFEYLT